MKIKRFFAKDMRTALAEVKETLGPDAVIMSNKKVSGGIEIVAAVDYQVQQSAAPDVRRDVRDDNVNLSSRNQHMEPSVSQIPVISQKNDESPSFPDSLSALLARQQQIQSQQLTMPRSVEGPKTLAEQAAFAESPAPRRPAPRPAPAPSRDKDLEAMRAEISSIRKLLQHQVSGLMWQEVERREPVRAMLIKQLNKGGFDEAFAEQLVASIPESTPLHEAWQLLQKLLLGHVKTTDDDILRHGGAIALLGPTGVGKTTTIAKLAARFAMKYGAEQVALITTDHYRIGAHEQLRIYGRILGVSVYLVKDAQELNQTLADLQHKHMVLVDTMGMSQRDRMVEEQVAMFGHSGVKRLLLLAATGRGDTLDDVVRAYSGPDLAGCILSKVDEAASLATSLDVIIRHRLPLHYVSNGQRVPEDLHLPNRTYLLHRAFKDLPESSPHRLGGLEPGLMMANASGAAAAGGRRG